MFGNGKNDKKEFDKEKVETILGAGTKVDGNINTKGSLRVEGTVVGEIKVEGDLFVGEDAKIKTKVEARNVVVAGKIEGDITAENKLEILPTGKIDGDIKMKTIKIEEGAKFEGNSKILNNSMNKSKQNKKSKKANKEKK